MLTFTQLVAAIIAVLPDATFDEDIEGQLIIYTNLKKTDANDDAPLSKFIPPNQ